MSEFSGSAMIALLPITTDWCRQETPHLTLVYAGEISKLGPSAFNELAKDAASIAMLSRPIQLRVVEPAIFGDEEKVDVFRLEHKSELAAMRRMVERWNASQHSFNPHVTIGPAGSLHTLEYRPPALAFDRVMVGWGDEHLTFLMRP